MNSPMTSAPQLAAVEYDPFAGAALQRVVPVTEPQREIWLSDRLGESASLAYNEAVAIELEGELNRDVLAASLGALVARHESMRATFSPDGDEFCISESGALTLVFDDLTALDAPARESACAEARRAAVTTRFDLERGPLFRARLLRLGVKSHLLLLSAHHIVCDGWSFGVVARELLRTYAARCEGATDAGLASAPSFAEHASAEAARSAEGVGAVAENYWLARHARPAPALELPLDRSRPRQRDFASARVDREFDAELCAASRKLGAARGASWFATLFTAFAATVARLAGQNDFVIGVAAAGQAGGAHEGLVGHCVNILPVRVLVDSDVSFESALGTMRSLLLDAFEHQGLTFGTLLKKLALPRDPSRPPLVNIVFNLDQELDLSEVAPKGLRAELSALPRVAENFELFLNLVQHGRGMRLECQFSSRLFDQDSVVRWLAAFEALLRAAVADASTALGRLPLLDEAARAALRALQPAPVPFDATRLAHQHVEAQVDAAPGRIAVRDGSGVLSYAELDERANRIARALRELGAGRGRLVGIGLERGVDMVAAVLGVLKSGAGYVPLDPAYPAERLDYMIGDAALGVLVTDAANAPRFAAPGRSLLRVDAAELGSASGRRPEPDPGRDAIPDSPAYVIYTSGSTGRPKGVVVPHLATANFLMAMQRELELSADDRLVAVTTLSFDIAFLELMLPLSCGAQVVVADRSHTTDGALLAALIESTGATMMQATPSGWRLLIDSGWRASPRFVALCGGEPLPPDIAESLLSMCRATWNLYGPTETTVWSTAWRVERPAQGIRIGRPVANTRIWILGENGEALPIGVAGEIWIGGAGVTRGYLNRPELDAERFVDGVASGLERGRLYRTGDRGRWCNDGTLEHLGRLDHQIKHRGYRIELGEIENALLADARIGRAAAMTREDRPGDVRLVAYVVPAASASIDEAAVKAIAARRLPDYMVPQHVIVLSVLPLLPNGKLDRKALPAPADAVLARSRVRTAPRDEIELAVAGAMQEVLALPELSIDDDFFALGGHSLLAAQLVARLNRRFEAALSLRSVFDRPTIADLAAQLRAVRAAPARPVLAHDPGRKTAPLSPLQERIWLHERMQPGTLAYNTPSAHRLRGNLDVAAFERAFNDVIERQAVLRTKIESDGASVRQVLEDRVLFALAPIEDFSGLPDTERGTAINRRLDELAQQPFQVEGELLFRAQLLRESATSHVFFFMTHHLIWDGWSFDLLYHEMAAFYDARVRHVSAQLQALEVSFLDCATWQRETSAAESDAAIAYWSNALRGELEPLELSIAKPSAKHDTEHAATEWLALDTGRVARLRSAATELGATPFFLLLHAFALVLGRLAGRDRIVVGTAIRRREDLRLEPLMGPLIGVLPLRIEVSDAKSIPALIEALRSEFLAATEHADIPVGELLRALGARREAGRAALHDAFFSYQDARAREQRWGDLAHEHVRVFQRGATEDVGLWILEGANGMVGGVTYRLDRIDAEGATVIKDMFLAVVDSLCDAPRGLAGSIDAMPVTDRASIAGWNATQSPYPRDASLVALLAAQVARTPDALALTDGRRAMTYRQLGSLSARVAARLRALSVGAGHRVGVASERSSSMVAALLGILETGACYVPLDPSYPQQRLRYIIEDSGISALILAGPESEALAPLCPNTLDLNEIAASGDEPDTTIIGDRSGSVAPAYLIYTSGSTGKPKGVVVPQRAVVNFLHGMQHVLQLEQADRLLAVTTLSFDIAVLELLLPLMTGASVVIATNDEARDPRALRRLVGENAITIMQATPTLWRLLLDDEWWAPPAGFTGLCGGEPMTTELARAMCARGVRPWNLYGPTETTVWSTAWPVPQDFEQIRIGRPIANTTVRVLDAAMRPVPIGVPGELWIGGDGLAIGYHDRTELTAERFRPDPHGDDGARLYRTGDRGRWCRDGQLQHLGRVDHQIKLRGHRIEPGEIESQLRALCATQEAVVLVRQIASRDADALVAYVLSPAGAALDEVTLRAALRERLPDVMIPEFIVALDELPRLPNGKLDRSALPEPSTRAIGVESSAADTRPSGEREIQLAEIWSHVLGVPSVRADDNFFDLGGHSLLVMQAMGRMESACGRKINPRLYVFQTLRQIAAAYDEAPEVEDRPQGLLRRLFGGLRRGSGAGT